MTLSSFTYDANGQVASITDRDGLTTVVQRDANGAPLAIVSPFGPVSELSVDADGTAIKPPGRPAHGFAYTPMNQEEEYQPPNVTPALAETRTLYAYDDDGRLLTTTRPDGGTIVNAYHASNHEQLVSTTLPAGEGQLVYTYYAATAASGAGMVAPVTVPQVGATSYIYDGPPASQERFETPQATLRCRSGVSSVSTLADDSTPSLRMRSTLACTMRRVMVMPYDSSTCLIRS